MFPFRGRGGFPGFPGGPRFPMGMPFGNFNGPFNNPQGMSGAPGMQGFMSNNFGPMVNNMGMRGGMGRGGRGRGYVSGGDGGRGGRGGGGAPPATGNKNDQEKPIPSTSSTEKTSESSAQPVKVSYGSYPIININIKYKRVLIKKNCALLKYILKRKHKYFLRHLF